MARINDVLATIEKLSDVKKALILQKFFKTGKGEYAEGDIFLGIPVPVQRKVAKEYVDLSLFEIEKLLQSSIHEHRLVALLILVSQYERGDFEQKRHLFSFYLEHTSSINNWDLVDLTAPKIVGDFLLHQTREVLYQMVRSRRLWDRRIAVLATFTFIREHQFEDSFWLCEGLLADSHDLIHKACGWMLREIGKRDEKVLELFLKKHARVMPRIMLRYAIERMSEKKRKEWFGKK